MKKHILIVEDNMIAMMVEKQLMESLDCLVDSAQSGEEAMELIKMHQYDLILMDIGLPGMDGIETTRKIRSYEEEMDTNTTPIVAVTGNADQNQYAICIEAGMHDVIVKPLKFDLAKSILLCLDQLAGNFKTKFEP